MTSRRHVAVIPGHGTVGTRRRRHLSQPRRRGRRRPATDWFFTQGVELVVDHCVTTRSGILILCESGVHGSPALIAVEAKSAADLPHRVTHAFLAATELATVPNHRLRVAIFRARLRARSLSRAPLSTSPHRPMSASVILSQDRRSVS
jgi:hypothetical protein